jgi:L-alanine-DL-glutamate epimerase-like enolase superfamily enzyme
MPGSLCHRFGPGRLPFTERRDVGGGSEETETAAAGDGIEILQVFLHVETDSDVTGLAGPVGDDWVPNIARFEDRLVGEDYGLFFDARSSWSRNYALDMIDRLALHDPDWVEEPVQQDRTGVYAELRDAAPFPIAGGEHEHTRFGAQDLLSRGAVDVLQMDTMWAGGFTEMSHAATLASVHDIPLIPHGHLVPANTHLIAAHSEQVCPCVEYLVRWNEQNQFFFENPVKTEDGTVSPPDDPGVGVELDYDAADEHETVEA